VIRFNQDPTYLGSILTGAVHNIQAENQILKYQVAGYEEVFKYKERYKKKGKPLFELQEGETAGWYSPQKMKTAQDRLKELEEEAKQQQQLKKQKRFQRQQKKKEKQQQMAARKVEREKARVEKAVQEAIKKAQREEKAIQKQTVKQLQDRMKSTSQRQLGKSKKKVQLDIAEGSDSNAVCAQEEVPSVSRVGRVRRQPQHLQGYIL
jgi:flagellar biosynthesis GTPase FlhF